MIDRKKHLVARKSSIGNRHGFTLIELLVVMFLIAALMALLLPALQRVHRQAKAVRCQATLRQSGVYFAAYAAENDGLLTMGPWDKRPIANLDNQVLADDERWIGVILGPSYERTNLLLCPAASKPKEMPDLTKIQGDGPPRETGTVGDRHSAWTSAHRQTDKSIDIYIGSFGLNVYAEDMKSWRPTVDIREAPRMPVYMDCIIGIIFPSGPDVGPASYEGCLAGHPGFASTLINRHDGGINCLFMDWSVRKVGMKELWTLKWWPGFNTHGRWTKAGGVQPEDWPAWLRRFKDY